MIKTNVTLQLVSAGILAISVVGCSVTDHSNDYLTEPSESKPITVPEGSMPIKDVLVIPNENKVADIDTSATKTFVAPRAPFIFHPMSRVDLRTEEGAVLFYVPDTVAGSKKVISDFLSAMYGDGEAIASNSDNRIVSTQIALKKQGTLAHVWSKITRVYPASTVFSFDVESTEKGSKITMQYREEITGKEPGAWMSPAKNDSEYDVAVRLWGAFGRHLNETSAYLSKQDVKSAYPIWIDAQGTFAVNLGQQVTNDMLMAKLKQADLYPVEGDESKLSPVPSKEVARVGDIVDLTLPIGTGGKDMKLFKVHRRNLNNVSWDKREYPYKIVHQKEGDFLVIDVSAVEHPESVLFKLVQRFVK